MPRRVAIYARLSITTEESVSIERQLSSARQYAAARGWTVVQEEKDDGVSATKNRPEDRAGWRAILESETAYDAVIVWKVDRLARRVLDFLHADEALQARGAGIVAVEDPVDMTTPQGRAFATMLAVFGEMEAAAMSARVKAARRALVHAGRRVGGRPPFGFVNVPNPDGPGMVLAHDRERIGYVEEAARRALAGESLYALARWLEAEGVAPRARRGRTDGARWHEGSIEAVLRSPALAGMTPYTPGRKPLTREERRRLTRNGERPLTADDLARLRRVEVLRDADGLPVVDESVAVLTPEERRRLLAALDARKSPGTRPVRSDAGLLSGVIRCASCRQSLHRATGGGRPVYRCQAHGCKRRVTTTRDAIESHVVTEFLSIAGPLPVVRVEEDAPAEDSLRLADIEAAISDTLARMADDDADVVALGDRLASLKAARSQARTQAEAAPSVRAYRTGETFAEAWAAAANDAARRDLLTSAVEAIYLAPAKVRGGRGLDPARVEVLWRGDDPAHADD
jgi:site-specific DNA recombinase